MTQIFHLTLSEWVRSIKTLDNLCWQGCGVRKYLSIADGSANLYSFDGNHSGGSLKRLESIYIKIQLPTLRQTQRTLWQGTPSYHRDTHVTMEAGFGIFKGTTVLVFDVRRHLLTNVITYTKHQSSMVLTVSSVSSQQHQYLLGI